MTPADISESEKRKQAIFDGMSARGQSRVLKMGYDLWNPFEEPKDPIDIRKDATRRTSRTLLNQFLESRGTDTASDQYRRGVLEICLGIINREDRYLAMFDFACWYRELLKKEGARIER